MPDADRPKQPADPKIAAAISGLLLTLQQMGVFDRLGWAAEDVLYWGSVAAVVATVIRAVWLHFWPPVHKPKGIPAGGMDDQTPSGPLSEPKNRRGLSEVGMFLRLFALTMLVLLVMLLTGCAGLSGPGLESVVSRIDIGKAIQCAKQPTPADKARCLGTQALTVGLGAALEQAALWGTRAIKAAGGAGADDLTDRDRRKIAHEADEALANLGAELAAAETSQ